MKKNENQSINLKELVSLIESAIESTIANTIAPYSKVLYKIDRTKVSNRIRQLNQDIERLNEGLAIFSDLFNYSMEASLLDNLQDVADIVKQKGMAAGLAHLKDLYVADKKIAIPGIKASKVVELYDFSSEVEESFESILNSIALPPTLKPGSYKQYFNDKDGRLILSPSDIEQINEQFSQYVSADALEKLIAISLLCAGLDNLQLGNGYSLNELPQIDDRLMPALSIDKPYGRHVEVNIDKAYEVVLNCITRQVNISR